jgi:hypothetical protein
VSVLSANSQRPTANRRRVLAIAALIAIVLSRINLNYVWRPFFDFQALKAEYARWADWWPQYPPFLEQVRAHTHSGDSIVIITPVPSWNLGYAYAFFRGSYYLTGRKVLPYISYPDVLHPENVRAVQYQAVYRSPAPPESGTTVVWRGKFGELLKR